MERLRLQHQRFLQKWRRQILRRRSARYRALLTAGLGSWATLAIAAILTSVASQVGALSGSWERWETGILCTTLVMDFIVIYTLSFCECRSYLSLSPLLIDCKVFTRRSESHNP